MFSFIKRNATEKSFYRNSDGAVYCLGDSCRHECNDECPIFLNTQALQAIQSGQYCEAIQKYELATKIAPDFRDAWNNMASCYGRLGQHEKALELYGEAYDLDESYSKALLGMILANKNLKNYDSALKLCLEYERKFGNADSIRQEIELLKGSKPQTDEFDLKDDMRAWMAGSDQDLYCFFSREYEKVLKYLNSDVNKRMQSGYLKMQELANLGCHEAMFWLGDYAEHGPKDMTAAAAWYKKAADAGNAQAARCYADLLMVGDGTIKQDIPQAVKYYQQAREHGIPEAAFVLGEYYRMQSMEKEAIEAYGDAANKGYEPAKSRLQQMREESEVSKQDTLNQVVNDMELLKILLDTASKYKFLMAEGVPTIPELFAQKSNVIVMLDKMLRSEYEEQPDLQKKHFMILPVWASYAGMGAVAHWDEDWNTLKQTGVVNMLVKERGINEMDEYVLDKTGIGFGSEKGDEVSAMLQVLNAASITSVAKLIENKSTFEKQFFEHCKAMYMFGIIYEMDRRGMK